MHDRRNNSFSMSYNSREVIFPRVYEVITELLTALVLINTNHKSNNINSTITDVATSNVIKTVFLDVNWVILIQDSSQTATASALFESTNGPAEQPTDNPPNANWVDNVNWTVLEVTFPMY
jgi:hypothetical protein